MNFIIEFIPKKDDVKTFAFVVRASNGFPVAVCDTLEDAKGIIEDNFHEYLKSISNADKK